MATKSDKYRLNRKQMKLAEMLANPEFTGTITELCGTVGIARSTFYDWLSDDEYRAYIEKLIDLYTDSELSRVWKALFRKIDEGDMQAIKLYFDLKGKYKRDNTAVPEAVNALAEALAKRADEVWSDEKES